MAGDSGTRRWKKTSKKVQKTFGRIKKLLNFATPFATNEKWSRKNGNRSKEKD
jgi:hypothetical protein